MSAQSVDQLRAAIGGDVDRAVLEQALTHRSYAYENGGLPTNERFEFLGDAVLGLVVTDELYRRNPEVSEGQLAKMRAAVVNARALAEVARSLGVGECLFLGRGEEATGGREKSSILSDALEAIIGAVYLDRGLDEARALVLALFEPMIAAAAGLGAGLDWKTSLQELAATLGSGVPEYAITDDGPDHAKTFTASVRVGEEHFGEGRGRSKKEAEQEVAAMAYQQITARRG